MKRILFILISLLSICGSVCLASDEKSNNIVLITTPGSLSTLLTQAQKDTCTQLTVRGKLNSADIKTLRHMAGYEEEGYRTGHLQILNLADAEFVTDKEPYMVLDAEKEKLAILSIPAKEGSLTFNMGEALQNKHIIDYGRFRRTHWTDFKSYKGSGDVYSSQSDLMPTEWYGSVYFHAKYYLGRGMDKPFKTKSDKFYFSEKISNHDWKVIKKKGLTHTNGHKLVRCGDKYMLKAGCKKGFLPSDMFHGCQRLQRVIIPEGINVDMSVIDEASKVQFFIPRDKITILYIKKRIRNHPYRASAMGAYGDEKKLTLYGDSATEIMDELNKLIPTKPKTNYYMDTQAKFIIEYADGRPSKEYYLDIDMKTVEGDSSLEYYKASERMIEILRGMGVINKFIKFKYREYHFLY